MEEVKENSNPPSELTEPKVRRLSREELAEFVMGVCDGTIYTSVGLSSLEIRLVFAPIVFGAFEGFTDGEIEQLGCLWQYLDQAGPRSINGRPSFMSMRLLHIEDARIAEVEIKKELDRRDAVKAEIVLGGGG